MEYTFPFLKKIVEIQSFIQAVGVKETEAITSLMHSEPKKQNLLQP